MATIIDEYDNVTQALLGNDIGYIAIPGEPGLLYARILNLENIEILALVSESKYVSFSPGRPDSLPMYLHLPIVIGVPKGQPQAGFQVIDWTLDLLNNERYPGHK